MWFFLAIKKLIQSFNPVIRKLKEILSKKIVTQNKKNKKKKGKGANDATDGMTQEELIAMQ